MYGQLKNKTSVGTIVVPPTGPGVQISNRRFAFLDGEILADFSYWRERMVKLQVPYCIMKYSKNDYSMFIDNNLWTTNFVEPDPKREDDDTNNL